MQQQQQPNPWGPGQQWAPPPANSPQGYWAPTPQGPSRVADFLMFRWMITPSIIVVLYVLGALGITLLALGYAATPTLYGSGLGNLLGAGVLWFFGQIYLRVILEVLVVLFRLYESVRNIDRKTRNQ